MLKDTDWQVRYRIWGMCLSEWGRWFPVDTSRPSKKQFIDIDVGDAINPAITPEDVVRVFTLLSNLVNGETKAV
jgi:hypothetical protein